jgi:hypothetical protein
MDGRSATSGLTLAERNALGARYFMASKREKNMPRSHATKDDPEQKTKEELDEELDRGLKESFPGSDPVSVTQPAPAKSPKAKSPRAKSPKERPGRH